MSIHAKFMDILGMKNIHHRGEWVSGSCPFAWKNHRGGTDKHPSFGIHISGRYNCFSCGAQGVVYSLPRLLETRVGSDRADEARSFIRENFKALAQAEKEGANETAVAIPEAALKEFKRVKEWGHINLESCRLWDIRFHEEDQRILMPVRDQWNRLVGLRGKYIGREEHVPKYFTYRLHEAVSSKKCGVWYGMHLDTRNGPLVVVEGERDAILLKQAGVPNVWACMGASPATRQKETLKRAPFRMILTMFDHDEAGQKFAGELCKACKGYVPCVPFPYNAEDPAELVESGGLTEDVLKQLKSYTGLG